jgi:hypothetical protein
MFGRVIILLLLVCGIALCHDFNAFATRFGKKYRSDNEKYYRTQLYLKKMA